GLPVAAPAPDAGLVPYVRVERVVYAASAPWPTTIYGAGTALRRLNLAGYANDPAQWTPVYDLRPRLAQSPVLQAVAPGGTATFSVLARGTGPLTYQWRFNGVAIAGATESTLAV